MILVFMQIPVTADSVDYMNWVTGHLDQFTQSHSGLFVGQGFTWLAGLFFLMAFKTIAMWGLFRRGDPFDVAPLVALFMKWAICYTMLSFYDSPIPGVGISAHQVFSEEARFISASIDLSVVNTLTGLVTAAFVNMEKPSLANLLGLYVFVEMSVLFIAIYALSFVVTVAGFCALGVGALLGPLFIPWFVTSSFEWIFWGWVRFMLIYSFWRVVSSALIYIWSNVLVDFFVRTVHGDYSLWHFMSIAPGLAVLVGGFMFSLLMVYVLSRDLFSGSASLGSPAGAIGRFIGAAASA